MPTAYHLGRQGDVPGGMTQVVNEYLTWEFPLFDQVLIPTRMSGIVASTRLALRALRAVASLPAEDSVVVAHLSQRGSFVREGLIAVRARRRGFPVVAQLHGSSFAPFARRFPRLTRLVLAHAHVVHVLSPESRDVVVSLGLDAEVVLIPNAVSATAPTPKTDLVLFGGAVTRRKGVDVLLEAWRDLPEGHGWQLVIAGPRVEPQLLEDLPPGVTAPGALPRAALRALLSQARVAALPSVHEAMPLFIIEALASCAAVITTPVGGIPTVIDETNGILVPVGDRTALTDALLRLITDTAAREGLARAGRVTYESRYSPAAVIPGLEAAWSRAIELRAATSA